MSAETWLPIPGWPYEASSLGRIRKNGRIIAARQKESGYWAVTLYGDGRKCGGHVARFVCMAFHGLPPSEFHHVDHIDSDRANDRPGNLRWLHRLENWKRRRLSPARGEAVKNHRLTAEAVREIRNTTRQTQALAARFGVSKTTIKLVRKGKAWAHV